MNRALQTLPTISGEKVSLRWLTENDIDSLLTIFSDREVMRYWSSPAMNERGEAVEYLADIHKFFRRGELFQWGVALNENDLIIGTCTLAAIDKQNRRAEIGYALRRDYWGKGLMRDALEALIDYAFNNMNLHRIEADVDPRNASSIRSLERLGFMREGFLRERWIVNGEIQDALFYGLLKKEWEARKS